MLKQASAIVCNKVSKRVCSSQRGFTLSEMLLVVLFMSALVLSTLGVFPLLLVRVNTLNQQIRLAQIMHQVFFIIEKDLRRSGFCAGTQCGEHSISISNKAGEPLNSCVVINYDLNLNGRWDWETAPKNRAEYFSYRLHKQFLEYARGNFHCSGGRWEKLFDPNEVVITTFFIKHDVDEQGSLFHLKLVGHSLKSPHIQHQIERLFYGYN